MTVLIIHTVYNISTHALTEGDAVRSASLRALISFQLTPSRRATTICFGLVLFIDISTHALTEGDHIHCVQYITLGISTHALTEGDPLADQRLAA